MMSEVPKHEGGSIKHDIAVPGSSPRHFPTGVGGVLLNSSLLDPRVLDVDEALHLCPTADDIWLYFMARLVGTQFRHTGWTDPLVTWGGSQGSALWRRNVGQHGNDASLHAMLDRFGYDIAVADPQVRERVAA